jgi:uncharacterized membrane protein
MISRFRTFIAGFLVLLPLAVTVAVIVWVGTFIYAYIGPYPCPASAGSLNVLDLLSP